MIALTARQKDFLAVGGVFVAVVQTGASIYFARRSFALDAGLQEAAAYQLDASYLKLSNQSFAKLMEAPAQTVASASLLDDALLIAFRGVHEQALLDPPEQRDQQYVFLHLRNRGTGLIHEVAVTFENGESITFYNLPAGEARLTSLEVTGRHAGVLGSQRRRPVNGSFLYELGGRQRAASLRLHNIAYWMSTEDPEIFQALPEFR
jgi:hypothetical protein